MSNIRRVFFASMGTIAIAGATTVALAGPMKHKDHAEVGAAAPNFTLTDTDGNEHKLSDFEGKVVVLEWFNPQCPFVVKVHERFDTMSETQAFANKNDVVWLAINSGAAGNQGNGLDLNKNIKEKWEINYPILLDESGEVGMLYGAKTTPHMFVIDSDGIVVYAGAIDDNPSPMLKGKTNYVYDALKSVIAGETVAVAETKSYGCSVKY